MIFKSLSDFNLVFYSVFLPDCVGENSPVIPRPLMQRKWVYMSVSVDLTTTNWPWETDLSVGLQNQGSMSLRLKGVTQLCGDLFRRYATPFSPGNVPNAQQIFPINQQFFVCLCLFLF